MTVPPSPMRHRQPSDDGMTRVDLTWIEKRIEHWIRFGRVAVNEIVDRRRRIVRFRPGAVFAFVRWASNDYGTIISRIDIVRAVSVGESFTTLPFVRPGGDILLKIEGWPKVSQVLAAIDAAEAAASIHATPHPTIGGTSTTALPPDINRAPTRRSVIAPG